MSSSSSDLPALEARTIEEVRSSTRFLLKAFKDKTDELRSSSGRDLLKLLRFGTDAVGAGETAEKFFGTRSVEYIAIDGTFAVDQKLDLLVFYVGAFGYSGSLRFDEDKVNVGDPSPMSRSTEAVSASIPLSEEDAAAVFGQRTESGPELDIQRLPNAIMHLAEYYIAAKTVSSNDRVRVVLLDRTLAGDLAHLVWSTKDLVHDHQSILEGMETPHGRVTNFDLELTRLLVSNLELKVPSPRSQFLKLAALLLLFDGSDLSLEKIVDRLGTDRSRLPILREDLEELDSAYHIFESRPHERFKLKEGVRQYWDRVLFAALRVADHIFNPGPPGHPMRTRGGDGKERWITADDLDYIVLVLILQLTQVAWERKMLPIGLIKDTGASELVKTLVPVLESSGLEHFSHRVPNFNSDKMLLQTNSVVNASIVPTPWHTLDMDAAFRTMVPESDDALHKGEARVKGAYRNVIYPERIFVKTYFQMWSSKNNPAVRSHVFSFDRPAFAGYDHWGDLALHNRDNEVDEQIRPILNLKDESKVTNLAMSILFEMSKEVVPEALGHNFPLFLADKKAKFVLKQSKEAYSAAVDVEMAKSDLDQQVLYSQRFRDYRSKVEASRRGGK